MKHCFRRLIPLLLLCMLMCVGVHAEDPTGGFAYDLSQYIDLLNVYPVTGSEAAITYTDTVGDVTLTVPAGWAQVDLPEEHGIMQAAFVYGASPTNVILYGCTDLYSTLTAEQQAQWPRESLDCSVMKAAEFEELLGIWSDDVDRTEHQNVKCYHRKYTVDLENNGEPVTANVTWNCFLHNGYLYDYCVYYLDSAARTDYITFLDSAAYGETGPALAEALTYSSSVPNADGDMSFTLAAGWTQSADTDPVTFSRDGRVISYSLSDSANGDDTLRADLADTNCYTAEEWADVLGTDSAELYAANNQLYYIGSDDAGTYAGRMDQGYLYLYTFSAGADDLYYSDFEYMLKSAAYPTITIPEPEPEETEEAASEDEDDDADAEEEDSSLEDSAVESLIADDEEDEDDDSGLFSNPIVLVIAAAGIILVILLVILLIQKLAQNKKRKTAEEDEDEAPSEPAPVQNAEPARQAAVPPVVPMPQPTAQQARPVQYPQSQAQQVRPAQYPQGQPQQPRPVQYPQGQPQQARPVQYPQGQPQQARPVQYPQGQPQQARPGVYINAGAQQAQQMNRPAQTQTPNVCRHCGNPLEADAKFCPRCGQSVQQ